MRTPLQVARDMRILGPLFVSSLSMGLWSCWSQYKALIQLPPTWAQAVELERQVRTVTTKQTVEHQTHPTATVTTTVQTTETKPQEPTT